MRVEVDISEALEHAVRLRGGPAQQVGRGPQDTPGRFTLKRAVWQAVRRGGGEKKVIETSDECTVVIIQLRAMEALYQPVRQRC